MSIATPPDQIMRRSFVPPDGLRLERAAKGARIVGHASVFNQWTTIHRGDGYEFREIVRPGAYRNALAEGQDVRALFNHNRDYVLGRTKSKTLSLREDSVGLLSEINPPDTQWARDVLALIERGDLSGMSFAFRPRKSGYRVKDYTRDGVTYFDAELTDADLFDVSVVTNPAYPQTDVGIRSLDDARRYFGLPVSRPSPPARSGPAAPIFTPPTRWGEKLW